MKVTAHNPNSLLRRSTQSLFCLLAVFWLQGPLVAGLVMASGACCTGDHCSIAAHHHAKRAEEMPADCDHNMDHGGAKVRSCSLSCCNATQPYAVHANVFLLSPVIELPSLNPPSETLSAFDADATGASLVPLSPPPKSPGSSLI